MVCTEKDALAICAIDTGRSGKCLGASLRKSALLCEGADCRGGKSCRWRCDLIANRTLEPMSVGKPLLAALLQRWPHRTQPWVARLQESRMRTGYVVMSSLLAFAACGGGEDAPVELAIQSPAIVANMTVVLRGTSFVPSGSSCPQSSEFIRIGSLAPHEIRYRNAATGVSGPVFADLWVCNSEDGRIMHWTSNPITLLAGENVITVTMTAQGRSSSASTVVRG